KTGCGDAHADRFAPPWGEPTHEKGGDRGDEQPERAPIAMLTNVAPAQHETGDGDRRDHERELKVTAAVVQMMPSVAVVVSRAGHEGRCRERKRRPAMHRTKR